MPTMPTIPTGPTIRDAEDTPARPTINWDRITLGEVDKIETLSGLPVSALDDDTAPKGRLLAAMVFVASRRYGEPKAWDQCLAMEVSTASEYLGMGEDEDQAVDGPPAGDDDGTDALEDEGGNGEGPSS